MCEIKLFELRDRDTTIGVMATRLGGRTPKEIWLLDHGGYGKTFESQRNYVILTTLDPDVRSSYDPYRWKDGRTLRLAHAYLRDNWEMFQSGDVVDVEFLEGERIAQKASEFPGGE